MTKEKMEKIAADMLACNTLKEAAELNGISDSSLRRLRKKPEFCLILSEAKAALYEKVFDRISGAALDSVAKIIEIRDNPDAPFSVQLAAAAKIVDLTGQQYSREEMQERLLYLERIFATQ